MKFEVNASKFDETTLDKSRFASAADFVIENSRQKAYEVRERCGVSPSQIIVSADTVVVLDNQILEKPLSADHAFTMLNSLSGRAHQVITGVTIVSHARTVSFHEVTEVRFTQLSETIIRQYIATGEPFDKAGGYGIQSLAAIFVSGITGDYYNVVGFPVFRFSQVLEEFLK